MRLKLSLVLKPFCERMEDPVRVQGLINLIQCETETQPKDESHSLRMEDNDVPSPNQLLIGLILKGLAAPLRCP